MKLREESSAPAHLIAYERADEARARASTYRVAPVADADAIKNLLGASLGFLAVVSKRRHLFLWDGVRIHIDAVDRLGDFIEFEAIADPKSDLSTEHRQVATLCRAFEVDGTHVERTSYCDLLDSPAS